MQGEMIVDSLIERRMRCCSIVHFFSSFMRLLLSRLYSTGILHSSGGTDTWKAPETEFIVGSIDPRERAKVLADYEAMTAKVQRQQQTSPTADGGGGARSSKLIRILRY
jgi:hypothetical protein